MRIAKCPLCGNTRQDALEVIDHDMCFCRVCFSTFCASDTTPAASTVPAVSAASPAAATAGAPGVSQSMADLLSLYGVSIPGATAATPASSANPDTMSIADLVSLAAAYESGVGQEKNAVKAFEHYKIAAEKGDVDSMFKVATAYENGTGVTADFDKAYFWYSEGARAGNERCGRVLRERFDGYKRPGFGGAAPVAPAATAAAAPRRPLPPEMRAPVTDLPPAVNAGAPALKTPPAGYTNLFSKMFMELLPSVVRIGARGSCGSGFIIGGGFIATNAHVVCHGEDAKGRRLPDNQLEISFSPKVSNQKYPARVLCYDEDQDIAILQCAVPNDFASRALPIGDSDAIIPGEDAFTIGNGKDYGLAFTKLCISQTPMPGTRFGEYDEIIQLTGSTQPGNSGGPVFNVNGEVIGIITFHPLNQNEVTGGPVRQVVHTAMDGVRFAVTAKTLRKIAAKANIKL